MSYFYYTSNWLAICQARDLPYSQTFSSRLSPRLVVAAVLTACCNMPYLDDDKLPFRSELSHSIH